MRFRKFIRTYFNFSKKEKNGLFVLFGIIAILILIKISLNSNINTKTLDFTNFEDSIDTFLSYQHYNFENIEFFYFDPNTANREDFLKLGISPKAINGILERRNKGYKFYKAEDLKKIKNLSDIEYEKISDYVLINNEKQKNHTQNKYQEQEKIELKNQDIKYFKFDPNTVNKQELEKLGFKINQINNLLRFREKGGLFKNEYDLKKIYGLTEADFNRLKDYIVIQKTDFNIKEDTTHYDILIGINKATEEDLQKIRGIGLSYSSRIIKYRNLLGGYTNTEQLLEVYGFSEDLYNSIKDFIYVDTAYIQKININTADFNKLVSHPYINKEDAIKILNYRKFAGKLSNLEELYQQKAVSKDFIDKISPYLIID